MPKLIISSIVIVSMSLSLFSQNPYYDAIKLGKTGYQRPDGKISFTIGDSSDISSISEVLRKYAPAESYYTGLLSAFNSNPFIALPRISDLSTTKQYNFSDKNISSGTASSFGGIDVTNLADGLAKFMVERAKEELTTAFFVKFKTEMKDEKYDDLRMLFPETYTLLMTIDKDIYRFNIYLSSMRETFQHDLANLYSSLPKVLNSDKYKAYFDNNPELKTILTNSLFLINSLSKKIHPGDILENFPINNLNDKDLSGAIGTLQLLSRSLKSKSVKTYWIPIDSLGQLFKEKDLITFKIYLGLIYQEADEINFNKSNLREVLSKLPGSIDSINQYKLFIEDLVARTNLIQEYMDQLITSRKVDLTYTDYYRYFNAVLDLLEMTNRCNDLPGMHFMSVKACRDFNRYIFVARRLGDVYININQTNYSSAIVNVVPIFDTLFVNLSDKDYSASKKLFFHYGTFMAGVATAQSSDEVKIIIESSVLPAGSSLIKSYSKLNISINSYIGGFAGHEWIKQIENEKMFNTAGISAPIGIAFSHGFAKNDPPCFVGAISAFISVVDLGALTSYRFGDDSTKKIPVIKLENILAPGFYIVLGRLGNTPLSFGIGYQYGPQLRTVTIDKIETVMNSSRVTAFLAVDIPFFNIYTKPKE